MKNLNSHKSFKVIAILTDQVIELHQEGFASNRATLFNFFYTSYITVGKLHDKLQEGQVDQYLNRSDG